MAEKKPDPHAPKVNNKLPLYGGILMAIGFAWSVYEFNPGHVIRAETAEEKKDRETKAKDDMESAAAEEKEKERIKKKEEGERSVAPQ